VVLPALYRRFALPFEIREEDDVPEGAPLKNPAQ